MSRTTGQWKQLLEGATPGPWEHDGESGVRGPREPDDLGRGPALLAAMQMPHRQPRKRHNAALMAAAPEAVAEVIRLRKGIESLRAFVDGFPLVPPLVGMGSIEDRAREMQSAASDALTRILEGRNDIDKENEK